MKGYKTFIGIALMVLASVGYGDVVSGDEVSTLIDNLTGVFGTALAIYGRVVAKKQWTK